MRSLHHAPRVDPRALPGRKPRAGKVLFERLEVRTLLTADFGYALSIGASYYDMATSVAADDAGNVYVAGSFYGTVDFDPGPGVRNLTSSGKFDGFLAEYSRNGALLWAGQIANGGDESADRPTIALGPDGDVYLTGAFSGTSDFDLGPGVSTLTADSPAAAFVARYTPAGGLTWARRLGGGTASLWGGSAITVDAAGNVYTAGSLGHGTADLDPGAGTFPVTNSSGNYETYLSKLDASGNFVWAGELRNNSNSGTVSADDIAVDSSQNLYVTGLFVGTADFDPGAGTALKSSLGPAINPATSAYVLKVTAAGAMGYFVSVGAVTGRADGYGIAVDGSGNAYVAGGFQNAASIRQADGTVAATMTAAGIFDAYAMKLSPTGALAWSRQWGSSGFAASASTTAVAYDGVNAIYLTGYYSNTVNFGPGTSLSSAGWIDVFTMRLGTDGSFGWAVGTGGTGHDVPTDVAVNGSDDVFTSGRYEGTADFDPGVGAFNLSSAGNWDGFLSKLTQTPANRAPVATDDAYSTDEDTPLTVAAPGVLANDSDPDGDPVTAALVSGPSHGTLALNADGSLTYAPAADFNGTDSFTYRSGDGRLRSNLATATITVRPVNDAPAAADDAYSLDEDTRLTVAAPGVLGNDGDIDGDPLSAALVSGPSHGTLALNADGSLTYAPAADFNGTDSFTYRAGDGLLTSDVATVSLTVRPVNDSPVAANQTFSIPENSANGTQVGVFKASDVDGDALKYGVVSGNTGGAFAIDPSSGRITVAKGSLLDFETRPRYVLTVRVTDPSGLPALATATINLKDVVERVPVAIDIKPGDRSNTMYVKSNAKVEVAIFSSATFDARRIDVGSLRFGRTGKEDSLSRTSLGKPRFRYQDLNGDRRLDLVVQFDVDRTGFVVGDKLGILTGRTTDGRLFEGRDSVLIKQPGK